jgi:alkylated DNA repair dioxygenase AlkB
VTSQIDFLGEPEDSGRRDDGRRVPEGFRYAPALISLDAERDLLAQLERLPFREFEFHGYTGKRRVVSYGWQYDFTSRRLREAEDVPPFLLDLRAAAADFAGVDAPSMQQVLVTGYAPGAGIGWHRDKAEFGDVVGISLLAPCVFRFRRASDRKRWERAKLVVEPRSAYLLRGPSRVEWEHSIPAVESLRYSVTYRTLRSV